MTMVSYLVLSNQWLWSHT